MTPLIERVRQGLDARPAVPLEDSLGGRAAVALILRELGGELELLFIRRSEHPSDPWSGQMAFPGGRAEPGESDLRETALRETAEEIGIDLKQAGAYLGALDEVRAIARGRSLDLSIKPYVFVLRNDTGITLNSEVRSVHWIPLGELLGSDLESTLEYAYQGVLRNLPCLRYQDVVIWGLTYQMFMSFRTRLLALA